MTVCAIFYDANCWAFSEQAARANQMVGRPEPANHLDALVRRSEGMFRP